ncbi:MAG: BPSS1780 family membrane protein [Betaproteobacteria bacterium]
MENPRSSVVEPPIRDIETGRGVQWWSDGWRLFSQAPGTWIGIAVAWLLINVALSQAGTIGNIASMILTPILSGGVMLAAHAQDRGAPLRFEGLFGGFGGGRLQPLLILGLMNLALTLVVAAIVAGAIVAVVGTAGLMQFLATDMLDIASVDLSTIALVVLALSPVLLIGFALIGMAFWFAPGLVTINHVAPGAALWLSFRANLTNIGAMLVYGLILVALALVATIPVGLGWIVLGPVMATSWYATWRDVFGAPDEAPPAPAPSRETSGQPPPRRDP